MYCSNCGNQLTDNYKFCPSCGNINDMSKSTQQPDTTIQNQIHKQAVTSIKKRNPLLYIFAFMTLFLLVTSLITLKLFYKTNKINSTPEALIYSYLKSIEKGDGDLFSLCAEGIGYGYVKQNLTSTDRNSTSITLGDNLFQKEFLAEMNIVSRIFECKYGSNWLVDVKIEAPSALFKQNIDVEVQIGDEEPFTISIYKKGLKGWYIVTDNFSPLQEELEDLLGITNKQILEAAKMRSNLSTGETSRFSIGDNLRDVTKVWGMPDSTETIVSMDCFIAYTYNKKGMTFYGLETYGDIMNIKYTKNSSVYGFKIGSPSDLLIAMFGKPDFDNLNSYNNENSYAYINYSSADYSLTFYCLPDGTIYEATLVTIYHGEDELGDNVTANNQEVIDDLSTIHESRDVVPFEEQTSIYLYGENDGTGADAIFSLKSSSDHENSFLMATIVIVYDSGPNNIYRDGRRRLIEEVFTTNLKHTCITYFGGLTYKETKDEIAMLKAADDLKNQFNSIIGANLIYKVYFEKWIVQ